MRVYNKTLDTNLWNEDNTLKPEIRSALLKIANDFFKSTDLTVPILNILFLGSSANYNWTPESDLDLHVVIDVSQLNIDQTLTRSFMDGLAAKWNNNHEIEIKGHPVEVYLQDIRERNSTPELAREGASIYSVLSNQWLKQPNHQKPVIDKEKILQKYKSIKAKISDFVSSKDVDKLKALMKAIRKYRDAGLTRAGEFGTENLVFKALRTSGDLTKLKDAINSIYDKSVTVNELKKKVVRESKFNPFDAKSLQFVTYGGLGSEQTTWIRQGFG
jgi:predicted nucleotidyltransferase